MLVRGTIAQRAQRVKASNSIPSRICLHILRLIENNYWVSSLDEIERPPIVTLPIHHILRLGKAINGNHHNLQRIVCGKLTCLASLLAIPHVVVHLWLIIDISKMVLSNL